MSHQMENISTPDNNPDDTYRFMLLRRTMIKAALAGLIAFTAQSDGLAEAPASPTETTSNELSSKPVALPDDYAEIQALKQAARAEEAETARQSEMRAEIAHGPDSPIDPSILPSKTFVGAFTISLSGDHSLPWASDAEKTYDSYYKSFGKTRPATSNYEVHRLMAGDTSQATPATNEMLSYGAVIDQYSSAETLIIATHNITPIHAPVSLNGVEYDQSQIGANAVNVPGDKLTLVTPSKFLNYVNSYTYVNTSHFIIDVNNQQQLNSLRAPNADGKAVVRVYKCWPAGSDRYRWVDEYVLESMQTAPGSVAPVGGATITNTNQ